MRCTSLRSGLRLATFLATLSVIGAWSAPSLAAGAASAESVLGPYRTYEALINFIGKQPDQCHTLPVERRVCVWRRLGNRAAVWAPLSSAAGTDERVTVVCSVPKDREASRSGECRVYPARSNRDDFSSRAGSNNPKMRRKRSMVATEQERVKNRIAAAQAQWDGARDLNALIDLAGDAPSTCGDGSEGHTQCTWRLSGSTFGHGTVASANSLPVSKKLVLKCEIDGDAKVRGSCSAWVGTY